jgi:hypothetical protein
MSWAQPFPRTWMLRPSHIIFPLYGAVVNLARDLPWAAAVSTLRDLCEVKWRRMRDSNPRLLARQASTLASELMRQTVVGSRPRIRT